MYRIVSYETGELIGDTTEPRYITIAKNGCFVQTDYANAKGLAFQSMTYNITGKEPLGDYPYVTVYEVDDGTVSMEKQKEINQLQEALSTTDEVAISLYEATLDNDEINAAQDDSIIEIYEMLGGN